MVSFLKDNSQQNFAFLNSYRTNTALFPRTKPTFSGKKGVYYIN